MTAGEPDAVAERAARYLVTGRVQGVGYRWFAREAARELGLRGWVRNRIDGSVEAEAAGDLESLQALAAELRRGPKGSRVVAVTTDDEVDRAALPAAGFEIRR